MFGRKLNKRSAATRRVVSDINWAITQPEPSESVESKNVSDFLYEIARPFTSCKLMQEPILARKIAGGDNWPRLLPSKSHALCYALWTTALYLIYHKGSFVLNDQDFSCESTQISSIFPYFLYRHVSHYIKTTISKKMNGYV